VARRIVEEEVRTTPADTTYIDDDASWAGRTIALIVLVALLIVGAIWLVNSVGDEDAGTTNTPVEQIDPNVDTNNQDPNTDTGDTTDGGDSTVVVPPGG
jgi:hypothetical protein